jgi:formylglycine-generating enzyme required for sulfatase activity
MQTIEFDTPTLDEKCEFLAQTRHTAEQFTENLGNGTNLEVIVTPAGAFQMGLTRRSGNTDKQPQHLVTIKSFLIGKFLITPGQAKSIIELDGSQRLEQQEHDTE